MCYIYGKTIYTYRGNLRIGKKWNGPNKPGASRLSRAGVFFRRVRADTQNMGGMNTNYDYISWNGKQYRIIRISPRVCVRPTNGSKYDNALVILDNIVAEGFPTTSEAVEAAIRLDRTIAGPTTSKTD